MIIISDCRTVSITNLPVAGNTFSLRRTKSAAIQVSVGIRCRLAGQRQGQQIPSHSRLEGKLRHRSIVFDSVRVRFVVGLLLARHAMSFVSPKRGFKLQTSVLTSWVAASRTGWLGGVRRHPFHAVVAGHSYGFGRRINAEERPGTRDERIFIEDSFVDFDP